MGGEKRQVMPMLSKRQQVLGNMKEGDIKNKVQSKAWSSWKDANIGRDKRKGKEGVWAELGSWEWEERCFPKSLFS